VPLPQHIIDRTFHTPQGEQGYRVCETLLDAGFEAWWVGGCVRDMLLGGVPKDIDIATSALPGEMINLFPKSDEAAKELGSIIVSLEGEAFEVTTYREDDDSSNGRQPEFVIFTTRENDAKRRDITLNALYWNPISSELYDPFEGEKDLNERLVRIIGNPDERLQHDALRLLRTIRFRAIIDGQYHPDTFKALHRNAKLIETLSGTRRYQELEKMLLAPHPEVAFEDLWETDVIEHLLPELHACKGVAQPALWHGTRDVWDHTMKCISLFTEDHKADVRWATLFHDVGKPPTFSIDADRIHFNDHAKVGAEIVVNMYNNLQFPKKRSEKISWLVAHHMMMGTFEDLDTKRKAHWYYHPWFVELLQLFWLDAAGCAVQSFDLYERIVDDYNLYLDQHPVPPKPLLTGHEVMELLGIQPGERVGEILKSLYDTQITGKIKTRIDAKEFVLTFF
jgi:putative nucleotidyltransferase with HDIG domain